MDRCRGSWDVGIFRRQTSAATGDPSFEHLIEPRQQVHEEFSQLFGWDRPRCVRIYSSVANGWFASRVAFLLQTPEGRAECESAFRGVPLDMIRNFAGSSAGEAVAEADYRSLGNPGDVENMLWDAYTTAGVNAWVVGYAWWGAKDGWQPNSAGVDLATLSDAAVTIAQALEPADIPDEAFFELNNLRGLSVYFVTLMRLGVPALRATTDVPLGRLIYRGGVLVELGWSIASAQHAIGW